MRKRRAVAKQDDSESVYELLAPAYEMLASDQRIHAETEALLPHLIGVKAKRIIDAGCGIGSHSLALADRGFDVVGVDRSKAMLRVAAARTTPGPAVRFARADLGSGNALPGGPADALLCLGNTIAFADSPAILRRALAGWRRSLRPGGLLIVQMRDLSRIPREGRAFPVRSLRKGKEEWILLRRHDPVPGGIRFQVTILQRADPDQAWTMRTSVSEQPARSIGSLVDALRDAGFARVRAASDLKGTSRGTRKGDDLVFFARSSPGRYFDTALSITR